MIPFVNSAIALLNLNQHLNNQHTIKGEKEDSDDGGYYSMKQAEEKTRIFFRKKYGIFWKGKVNPKNVDWILCDEYYKKFREMLNSLEDKTPPSEV